MKLVRRLVYKYLVYFLPIIVLILLRESINGFFWIFFYLIFVSEVSLIAWKKNKGIWETEPNYAEAKKWAKSLLFNAYVFLLLIHYVSNIYFWIMRPSYTSDELEFSSLLITWGVIMFGSIALNSLALFTFVRNGVPRQILLIPISDFIFTNLPAFFPLWLWRVAMESRFFVIVMLVPLVWVLYIRFIFLNPRPIEDLP